jgi:chaperonin cofactor prefoldin
MVQEQSGTIQHIHDTLSKITMSEAYIDSLQDENDQTTDQLNQLQENMPSTAVTEAYP